VIRATDRFIQDSGKQLYERDEVRVLCDPGGAFATFAVKIFNRKDRKGFRKGRKE
jgi:hypothetical protein